MNVLQVCRQLQCLLSQRKWKDVNGTVGEFVFASVAVTAGLAEDADQVLRMPLVLVNVGDAETDDQAPGFERTTLELTLAVAHSGDTVGQAALLGGQLSGAGTQGQGSSQGRGLLEVEEQLLATLRYLDQTSGVRLALVRKGAATAGFDPGLGYVCHRSYLAQVRASDARSYDAPLSFRGTASGTGHASLVWANPPLRFDFAATSSDNNQSVALGARLELRRLAGAAAPLFPNQNGGTATGTLVYTSTAFGALPTTYVDTPGAGTWSYALAAAFDESGSGTQERWSDVPATILGLVVT